MRLGRARMLHILSLHAFCSGALCGACPKFNETPPELSEPKELPFHTHMYTLAHTRSHSLFRTHTYTDTHIKAEALQAFRGIIWQSEGLLKHPSHPNPTSSPPLQPSSSPYQLQCKEHVVSCQLLGAVSCLSKQEHAWKHSTADGNDVLKCPPPILDTSTHPALLCHGFTTSKINTDTGSQSESSA